MAIDFNANIPEGRVETKKQSSDLNLLGQIGKLPGTTGGVDGTQSQGAGDDNPILLADGNCGWRACYGTNPRVGNEIQDADRRLRRDVDRREQDLLEQGRYDRFLEEQRLARERAKANRNARTNDPRCEMKWDKLPAFCQPQSSGDDILDQEPPPPRGTRK